MGRDRLLKDHLRHRYVVTLKSGETFDGLLDRWDEQTVELVNPYAVTEQARVEVDGTLVLPRANIAYMQRPES